MVNFGHSVALLVWPVGIFRVSISVRKFLANFIVCLIIFTGFVPVVPHDDFGSSAHAHDITSDAPKLVDFSADEPKSQENYSTLHCFEVGHFFTIVAPISYGYLISNGTFESSDGDLPSPQTVRPSLPPPNV